MTTPRKISVMTGTRAEYGLLYWLLHELRADQSVDLSLIVSAMHLAPEFGRSVDLIQRDGFTIDAEVPCLVSGDDRIALGKSMGLAHLGFVDALARLTPDLLVLLGDRFETLAAATAATALGIPVAHLHGGEISEGAIDDAFRHALTKLSHIHFVAASAYRRRVVQMGEQPQSVHVVGALGLENFLRLDLPDATELSRRIDFDLTSGFILLTYHPETVGDRDPVEGLNQIIEALHDFHELRVLATKANADPGGRAINARLAEWAAAIPNRVRLVDTLGQVHYLAAMRAAAAVLGNSSSGIIEAPAVDVPTVNIGTRQDGRLKAASIVDCDGAADSISRALRRALEPQFRATLEFVEPPYGRPRPVARRIVEILRETDLSRLLRKSFYDIDANSGAGR